MLYEYKGSKYSFSDKNVSPKIEPIVVDELDYYKQIDKKISSTLNLHIVTVFIAMGSIFLVGKDPGWLEIIFVALILYMGGTLQFLQDRLKDIARPNEALMEYASQRKHLEAYTQWKSETQNIKKVDK